MKTIRLCTYFWLGICLTALSFGVAAQTPQTRVAIVKLDIKAQSLGTALAEFAQQSGVRVFMHSDVGAGVTAPSVSGRFSPDEALEKLLSRSGLGYSYVNPRAVEIYRTVRSFSEGKTTSKGKEGKGKEANRYMMRVADLRLAEGPATEDVHRIGTAANARESDNNKRKQQRGFLEEVIVTATKREERLQDIPMSIAVISNQDIERRGVIGMEDYLRSVPGVNEIDKGGADNAIVIRGITTSPELQNNSSSATVATYFDETPITAAAGRGAGGIDVRPVDIERIEVLRGPQGTAYGSASLGGAMRMIPVKPQLDGFSAKLAGSLSTTEGHGSENWMGQGVVNIPVVEDKFATRAVAYRYDESGFYRNIAGVDPVMIAFAENFGLGDYVRGHVQNDVGRMRSSGGRVAGLWQATDKLNLSMNFLTQTIEQDGTPLETVGKFEQSRTPIAPQGRVRGKVGEIADTDIDLLNLVLNYDFGWAELTSAVSWIDSGSVSTFAPAGVGRVALGPSSFSTQSDFKSVTAEVRLASQFEGRFQFLGGLFYEDVDEDFWTHSGDWPGTPATNPFRTDPIFLSDVTRQLDQRAMFGEVSYDLTEKLTATVGGRYYKYEKDQSILFEGGLLGLVGGVPRVPIGGGIAQILESSESDSILKANLSYKPTQESLLYASWAEGFRLGQPSVGLPPAICDTDGDGFLDGTSISIESTRTINSDFLENYEVGGKFALFDRRMVLDTAVYHIEWDGLPILTIARCGNISAGYTANVGAATSDGVEFQASLFVMDGLRLDFGGGYTKAELSKDAPALRAQKGARLPASPQVSANLAAQYDFEVAGYKTFVRADAFYTGEFYSDLLETPTLRAGDYIKVDARAGVEIKKLSVELFVRNLTDEDAFTWHALLGGGTGASHRLRPRTIGIQLGYSFE